MSLYDLMAVDLPEGSRGNVSIERFTVEVGDLRNIREAFSGRGCVPGEYTRLIRDGHLWMSDTTAERRDHLDPALAIERDGGRVLIGGLGLGMIVRVALLTAGVDHVDVVEVDEDVCALIGPHYAKLAAETGVGFTLHHDDMYAIKWRPGTRWNVAWFDIWPTLCIDNLGEMAKLRRSYGRRCDWHECWGRHLLLRERRHEQSSGWWR